MRMIYFIKKFRLFFMFENNANRTWWISLLKACYVRSTVINEPSAQHDRRRVESKKKTPMKPKSVPSV